MHCPKCGQQQISEATRFCSRCGFLLTGIAQVVANEGVVLGGDAAAVSRPSSPRRRGIKQGLFVFLLAFLVVPIVSILTIAINAEPFAVALAAILLIVGGLLRIVYAFMFESAEQAGLTLEENLIASSQKFINRGQQNALPPERSIPATDYMSPNAGSWRDTNDLQRQPNSVTERTTKLLHDEQDQ